MITTSLQKILDFIDNLSAEEQDYLFEFVEQKRIEKRQLEIAINGEETLKSLAKGTAIKGSAEDIKAYLLANEEE
jgi:hypothetical protein